MARDERTAHHGEYQGAGWQVQEDSAYNPKAYKVVATYGTQIKGMQMDGKHKTRDSQRCKKVQVQDRRCYGEVERPSSYLDETDIGAGTDNQGHDFVVVNFEGEALLPILKETLQF